MPDATPPSHEASPEDRGQLVNFPRRPEHDPHGHEPPLKLTSLVGREREISALKGLLEGDTRLLTLTGPGGSGKTRLASAVAMEVVEDFEDGVWWVELAPLSDPDLVVQALARVLNVPESPGRSLTETITEDLRDLEILIVLDNCEHLVEACALLADALLRYCPNLCILATSREALGVAGERNFPVPPLSSPRVQGLSAEELEGFEAVRLFVERASYRRPDFVLDAQSGRAVAEICRRLDGMPLAIELAAAKTRVLSAEQISSRLDDSFRLLKSESRTLDPRQRTLGAAIDWSYDLLDELERVLLRRLSVFAGRFTLMAAEAVCSGEGIPEDDVLDLLSHLVDKSLLLAEEEGDEIRYRMLETVRQYGREKIVASGNLDPVSLRHARYYLTLAEEAEAGLRGPDQVAYFRRLEEDIANFRAALSWTLDKAEPSEELAQLGLRLTVALWLFWNIQGSTEGHRWVEEALRKSTGRTAVRARALGGAGWMSLWGGDYGRAISLLEESIALFRELGDTDEAAISLAYLGMTAVRQADEGQVFGLREEAETLRREPSLGRRARAELLFFLAAAASSETDFPQAMALFEESLAMFRDLEDARGISRCLISFGMVSVMGRNYDQTESVARKGLESVRELGDRPGASFALLVEAALAGVRNEPVRAARLWGAAEALREAIGLSMGHQDRVDYDYEGRVAAARAQLDDAAWKAAWNEGRTMSPEQAVDYALQSRAIQRENITPSPQTYPAGLSAREVDVLTLVAQGLTNARIARQLFISPNTVNRHLNSVYRKLDVSSRAAAARFAAEHRLA
jgi:predicted ATPase/DNA-binding CsgD family transcriptional regulator